MQGLLTFSTQSVAMTTVAETNVDYNAQTALDIGDARRNAKLEVAKVRALLHGGYNSLSVLSTALYLNNGHRR